MSCQTYEAIFDFISPYSLPVVSVYLVSIFRLFEYRENKQLVCSPVTVRPYFRVWCLGLALYSFFAFLGMTFPAISLVRDGAWLNVKSMDWRERGDCCFWVTTFFLSKFIELGDTYFILFLNRPLILLQWFHHMTTLLYVQHALTKRRFSSFWFIYMNLFVHSIMYAYYVKAFLKPWIITFLQVLQMIGGLSIVLLDRKDGFFDVYGFTMYALYFYLFLNYFMERYVWKTKKKQN